MPARLRVGVVARAVMPLHGLGGLERSVHDLVRHLALRGVRVTLIVPPAAVRRGQPADPFASPLIQIRHVRYVTFPFANRRGTTVLDRSTSYLLYGWRAGRLALSLARAGEINIIHGYGASVLGAARRGRPVPLVLNPQGLEEFGATGAALPRVKRVGYAPLRWAVRRVAHRADRIIATDVALEATIVRHLQPRPDQLCTIPNGIDLVAASALAGPADGLMLRQRHGLPAGNTVLLSVGRLEYNKGFDLMAAALARAAAAGSALSATGWTWVIVGAGPYRHELERLVRAHGIAPHVRFAGRATEADLHAWYEAASLFVHPTRYEGSSLVALEAMAHRRPVIATAAGGLPDKVLHGVNGWLVAPNDVEGLAAALTDAVANPRQLTEMGARSREIVERDFSWSVLVDRQIALYEEIRREWTSIHHQ
jgi:glycosyltransferase involved in cell wall biosynthesis